MTRRLKYSKEWGKWENGEIGVLHIRPIRLLDLFDSQTVAALEGALQELKHEQSRRCTNRRIEIPSYALKLLWTPELCNPEKTNSPLACVPGYRICPHRKAGAFFKGIPPGVETWRQGGNLMSFTTALTHADAPRRYFTTTAMNLCPPDLPSLSHVERSHHVVHGYRQIKVAHGEFIAFQERSLRIPESSIDGDEPIGQPSPLRAHFSRLKIRDGQDSLGDTM